MGHTYFWFDYLLLHLGSCHLAEQYIKNWCHSYDTVSFEAVPKTYCACYDNLRPLFYHFPSLGGGGCAHMHLHARVYFLSPGILSTLSGSKMIGSTKPRKEEMHFWAVIIYHLEAYPWGWHYTHVTLVLRILKFRLHALRFQMDSPV